MVQNRTLNSSNIKNKWKKKVVGISLFINNNFHTWSHVTLLILIRKRRGNMLHVIIWYKCWPFRFASSSLNAAGFLLSLVITLDGAQKRCCSGRMKANIVFKMFRGMWIKSVFLFCNVQLMQVRFPL